MRIKEITSQHRRDFWAVFVCEHCGHEEVKSGYDDRNFHENVIPRNPCQKCGETASGTYRPLSTKYPDGLVV
jgi:transcription elongation factor Elf1